jgi:acetyl esterase/lipase
MTTHAAPRFAGLDRRPTVSPELAKPRMYRVFDGAHSYFELPYAVLPGFRPLVLDLHVPDRVGGQPVPVVVYVHGGGFVGGTRTMGPWAFLLAAGYAVACVDYRLSGEARFPLPAHDVAAAVRWVRANAGDYGLDADRLAGFGTSAGGYLINLVGLASDHPDLVGELGPTPAVSCRLAAVIDHFAPVDFLRLQDDALEPSDDPQASLSHFLGFVPAERPAEAERASLCSYATAASPPFLIAHGDTDGIVGTGQSRRLHEALTKAGGRAELVIVPNAGHNAPEFDQPTMQERTLTFLSSVFGPATPQTAAG